jgi:hypothetical protein
VKAPRGLTYGRRLPQPETGRSGSGRGCTTWPLGAEQPSCSCRPVVNTTIPGWARSCRDCLCGCARWRSCGTPVGSPRMCSICWPDGGFAVRPESAAELVYVWLHGPDDSQLYGGSYSDDDPWWWAGRNVEWASTWHRHAACRPGGGRQRSARRVVAAHWVRGTCSRD